jgi:hypothetical protein
MMVPAGVGPDYENLCCIFGASEREESSRRVYSLLWKTASASITMLLMIVAYLLTHASPWQTLVK